MYAQPLQDLEIAPLKEEQGPDFWTRLAAMERKYRVVWEGTGEDYPLFGVRTAWSKRYANFRHCRQLIEHLADEVRELPDEGPERSTWRQGIKLEIQDFGEKRFDWPRGYRNLLVSEEFYDSTVRFARWAREFDPKIQGVDVAQALRNVWIVNSLQMLFGQGVILTPAVFAYSMLYPYTDNFLDDPSLGADRKRSLNEKLGRWLDGRPASPTDRHQKDIRNLVRMIESQFDRPRFPSVYSSLKAIHEGQKESLRQRDPEVSLTDSELLTTSVRKGGASVLADGYLVSGTLLTSEEDFCMGYGVFLQLLDDLQDVQCDHEAGHQTLFTRAAESGPLDGLTSRLYHFMHSVVRGAQRISGCRHEAHRDLILRNCVFLLVGAVAENAPLFSRRFRRHLGVRWPLSLRSMRRLRQQGEDRFRRAGEILCLRRRATSWIEIV